MIVNVFRKGLLAILLSMSISSAFAQVTWPETIIRNGTGEIIYSQYIDVSEPARSLALNLSGGKNLWAFVGLSGTNFTTYKKDSGIYRLHDANNSSTDIGIAFVGTIEILEGDKQATAPFNKTDFTDTISSTVLNRESASGFDDMGILSGHIFDNTSFLRQYTVRCRGQILLLNLTNDPDLLNTTVKLPEVSLRYCGNKWCTDRTVISAAQTISVISPRTCNVTAESGLNINFGEIPSTAPVGELVRNKETILRVQCSGRSNADTNVYLEIFPIYQVSDSETAIGLNFANASSNPSSDLVVKARFNPSDTTACTVDGGNWLKMSPERYQLDVVNKILESYSKTNTIYWSLCKLTNKTLTVGDFSGSATLSITFN